MAWKEAAEGTLAGQECTQRGCKASAGEGRRDRWLPDTLVAVRVCSFVHGRAMYAWAEPRSQAALVRAGRVDTGPPGRAERVEALQSAAGGTAEE